MSEASNVGTRSRLSDPEGHRARLLAGVPIAERSMQLAGIPTAVLDGGEGPPMVLLHGPGESAETETRETA